jgi:hypothetical protein
MKNSRGKNENPDKKLTSQTSDKKLTKDDSDPENKRTKKPGSQSGSANRHNNGRGGGK